MFWNFLLKSASRTILSCNERWNIRIQTYLIPVPALILGALKTPLQSHLALTLLLNPIPLLCCKHSFRRLFNA